MSIPTICLSRMDRTIKGSSNGPRNMSTLIEPFSILLRWPAITGSWVLMVRTTLRGRGKHERWNPSLITRTNPTWLLVGICNISFICETSKTTTEQMNVTGRTMSVGQITWSNYLLSTLAQTSVCALNMLWNANTRFKILIKRHRPAISYRPVLNGSVSLLTIRYSNY